MSHRRSGTSSLPFCYICSFYHEQNIYHKHISAREIRVVQGVDQTNLSYMCTTCKKVHSAEFECLNVLVSSNHLHNIHTPVGNVTIRMEPDPQHIEWVTVCDATIDELRHAWYSDYGRTSTPMRILLSPGSEDFYCGKSVTDIIESIMYFKQTVNRVNPGNELIVTTMPNPPNLAWFEDNGAQPRNYTNKLMELKEVNNWIVKFNEENGKHITPRFHRFGIRDCMRKDSNGRRKRIKQHIFSHWCDEKPKAQRNMLIPEIRIKMGIAVTRYFAGEMERNGIPGRH